ncbi:hypothetical protein RX327_33255 [Bradyrhizobium sp. BEA-2-5]|nr:hypothetical protein [Bradyrhizobium sp. BEA-2-5]WOH85567.1 hypothetical protein RX327_33255 [Bradyrhizobium sp. BEA-2-5]
MDKGEVVGGEPVAARRHPTTLFDLVENRSTCSLSSYADLLALFEFFYS